MVEPKMSFPEFIERFERAVRELVASWKDHQLADPDTFEERMTASEWMGHVNALVDFGGGLAAGDPKERPLPHLH